MLGTQFKQLTLRAFARYVVCFSVGLSPYLLLVWAGQTPRPGSWGDTSSVSGLLRHVLRQEYGSLRLSPSRDPVEDSVWERNLAFLEDTLFLFQPYGLPVLVAVLGIVPTVMPKGGPHIGQFGTVMLLCFGFYLAVFHSLANLSLKVPMAREVHRRFWIQPHLFTA